MSLFRLCNQLPKFSAKFAVHRTMSLSVTGLKASKSSGKKSERQILHEEQLAKKKEAKIKFESFIEKLPSLRFPRRYTIDCTNATEEADSKLAAFLKSESGGVYGVDFEWPPCFKKGKKENKISLIQICAAKSVLLFQVGRMKKLPKELQDFFENKELLKTGVNIRMDGLKLARDFGVKTNGLVELMTMANNSQSTLLQKFHYRSLRALTAVFLNQKMAKGSVRMSNWAAKVLSAKQKEYAALDAYASFQIFRSLTEEGITTPVIEHLSEQNIGQIEIESTSRAQVKVKEAVHLYMVEASIPKYYSLEEREYTVPYYNIRNDYNRHHSLKTPIIIDNGSKQCRAGWATESDPSLVFDNVVSKYKDRRLNANVLAVGMDALADPAAKSGARSPFDSNVICDFEKMESVLDYIFLVLGINTSSIQHPVVMTEAICNPQYSRNLMNELLFEGYNVPSVVYGIDALFSYHANGGTKEDGGIIISSGNTATNIIPTLGGKGVLSETKRINYGGTQATDYMLKLMQLKYPTFPTKMTTNQAEELVQTHAFIPKDYQDALKMIENRNTFQEIDRIIQFPFTAPVIEEKSVEELARQAAKKEENSKRLRELAARSRLEKLVAREQQHEAFTNLKESKGKLKKADFLLQLKETGFANEADLDDTIKQLDEAIQRARNKELGIEEAEEKEPPATNMIDIPDDQLDEAGKKEKRKQKLMKANYDARQRAKKAKEEAKIRGEKEAKLEEQKRNEDPDSWILSIKKKRQEVIDRIKKRKRLASELADRRSRASQLRMKSIANLASDSPTNKRRKKGTEEDTFGQDDEDWAIYREINREDESDEEEEDVSQLNQYEELLLQHDSQFSHDHLYASMSSPTNTLVHLLTKGVYPSWDPTDMAQSYQLHVNVERIRVPEVIFQPSIIGLDQAGLIESINDLVKTFDNSQRQKIMQNVFITGGYSQIPGITDRVRSTLKSIYPTNIKLNVRRAKDARLDAWRGAAMFGQNEGNKKSFITRKEYDEYGTDYIKEHGLGNIK